MWGYENTLHNPTDEPLTVYERHWTITPFGHDPQFTIGAGVGGKLMRLLPRESKSYISGVPLPTGKGGTMSGFFRALGDDGSIHSSAPLTFQLPPAEGPTPRRQIYSDNDTKAEAGAAIYQIDAYRKNRETFDTANLPPITQQEFARTFLRMDKVRAFNSTKTGEINRYDITSIIPYFIDLYDDNNNPVEFMSNFEYNDIALFAEREDWTDLRVIFLNLRDTYNFLQKSGIDPALFPELAERLNELLAAYRPAGRVATGRSKPDLPKLLPTSQTIGSPHAPPPGYAWPTETYSASPEAKRGGGGIVAYLERVWLPLLEKMPGVVDLRTLRTVDPSAAMAINNFTRGGRKLPTHFDIPTKREVNDRALAAPLIRLEDAARLVRAAQRRTSQNRINP